MLNPNQDLWRYHGLMAERTTYEALMGGLHTVKEIAEYQGRSEDCCKALTLSY